MPEKVQKELQSTTVYIEENKKIKADIKASNIATYTCGGLLPALVDCIIMDVRQNRADEAMVDLQKEIQSFNFRENVTDRLTKELQSTGWLNVKQVHFVNDTSESLREAWVENSKSDGTLISRFIWQLNPDFSVLTGTLYVEVFPTSPQLKKLVNCEDPLETPIFKFNISATHSLAGSKESLEENAALWAQEKGCYVRKALAGVIEKVFCNLKKILQNPNHLPEAF